MTAFDYVCEEYKLSPEEIDSFADYVYSATGGMQPYMVAVEEAEALLHTFRTPHQFCIRYVTHVGLAKTVFCTDKTEFNEMVQTIKTESFCITHAYQLVEAQLPE